MPKFSEQLYAPSSVAEREWERKGTSRKRDKRGMKRKWRRSSEGERERAKDRDKNPRRVGPLPPTRGYVSSMLWKTGFHCVVFTYAP